MRFGWKISIYILRAVVPYFALSWLLLSVILFVQQGSRFSDIFFSANIPTPLIWQLSAALIPNVIAFTCPMAVLVGVVIGLAKMQGDSELVAIRAAGVGNLQITLPVIVLGAVLSAFAFAVNVYGVPLAAAAVRMVAMRAAIYKLESPVEPGVFNTEVAGYTIYVKDGDLETGSWKDIFVHVEDKETGTVRLITSSSGRIDSTDEQSELVLMNAVSSTFNPPESGGRFVSESIGEVRLSIKTRRGELIERLRSTEISAEELGLGQLAQYSEGKSSAEQLEAAILWQRRLLLSVSPLIFSILGTVLILRFNRAGRGFGTVLALAALIGFYLSAFLGEQLARTSRVSIYFGGLLPVAASGLAIIWFSLSSRSFSLAHLLERIKELTPSTLAENKLERRNIFMDLTTGLRDFDLLINISKFYLLTLAFLAAVFVIFTAFELWKFAGTMDGGIVLLIKYLIYLLPFVYLQLAPSAAMIAVLATYVIKSRQNEIVTWTGAGQSVYRLLFPAIFLMLCIGIVNVLVQEFIAPSSNQHQDTLRSLIRGRGKDPKAGRQWVATGNRIFGFAFDKSASDNEQRGPGDCNPVCLLEEIDIYEFEPNGHRLQTVYRAESASWGADVIKFTGMAEKTVLEGNVVSTKDVSGGEVRNAENPMIDIRAKPSQLNILETIERIERSDSAIEKRSFMVALEKKYSTAILPFVIALFTAPFALSLSRKGKAVTVGFAVGLWLLFMGATAVFEQLGNAGSIGPAAAVWGPLVLFALLGVFLMTRVKT